MTFKSSLQPKPFYDSILDALLAEFVVGDKVSASTPESHPSLTKRREILIL